MFRNASKILFLAFTLTLSACSSLTSLTGPSSSKTPIDVAGEDSGSANSPFRLEVSDEVNDGNDLSVRGQVVLKTGTKISNAVVRLSGLDAEGETQEASFPLKFPAKKTEFTEGDKIPFALSIPISGVDHYQLEVRWGKEARVQSTKSTADQFVALRNVSTEVVRSTDCVEDCAIRHRVMGDLFNGGEGRVTGVVLGAGFLDRPTPKGASLDLQVQIPENERRIEVRNLNLGPQESKAIRLMLDQPEGVESSAVLPSVRIISVETK